MRAFGVFLVIVAVCVLFLGAPPPADAREPRTEVDKAPPSKTLADRPARPAKGKAVFPSENGDKMGGTCDITCSDGWRDLTWAENVGDCACQCSSICGESCFAWEIGGSGTAWCSNA